MGFRLLGDRVLVKVEAPVQSREVDGHTIYYPEGAFGGQSEVQCWAEVVQVGSGAWAKKKGKETGRRIPMEVEVGDRVRIVWLLTKVETNRQLQDYLGEGMLIVRTGDLLCVEKNTDQSAAGC